MQSLKIQFSVLFFVASLSVTWAQTLPDVQHEAKRPPANVKIDGELSEWGSMAAYNKGIILYYTLANDDENLYLAVKSDNSLITHKILQGGFSFTVNSAEKKVKGGATITYPFVDSDKTLDALSSLLPKRLTQVNKSAAEQKEANEQLHNDMIAANRKILNLFKFIKIAGVKQIADKEISLYNQWDIKVGAKLDSKGNYTYELAIPLKLLGMGTGGAKPQLFYNIKLLSKYVKGGMTAPPLVTRDGKPPLGPGGIDVRTLALDTDFWAEYTMK